MVAPMARFARRIRQFYTSPGEAAQAAPETHAYVVTLNTGTNGDRAPDALTVLDFEQGSPTYGQVVGRLDMPDVGDELHHFGWNACSSALCPWAPHPHVERRYLLVPGLRSSKIHVVDVKDDPATPKIVKVIEAEEIARKAGYSRPHTIHCGPDGIYVSALGNPEGDGPGRHLPARPRRLLASRAPGRPTAARRSWPTTSGGTSASTRVLTSEWGTPNMVEDGLVRASCCSATSTATSCTCGTSRSAPTSRRSTSAPSTRWCSSCARPTTCARRTGSSASSPRPPTCRPPCGCGSAPTTAR